MPSRNELKGNVGEISFLNFILDVFRDVVLSCCVAAVPVLVEVFVHLLNQEIAQIALADSGVVDGDGWDFGVGHWIEVG